MNFARETLDTCLNEAKPLLIDHWKEIAQYDDILLDVDTERYYNLERSGFLRIYTARKDGLLVGYAVFVVNTHPHYKNSLQAMQDIIFIHPSHRGTGGKFILWCDRQLKDEGVQVVFHHIKAKHDWGKMLERFGYELIDKIYGRRLDRWD